MIHAHFRLFRLIGVVATRANAVMRLPATAGILGMLAVIALILPLRAIGALQPIELAAYDRMVALRGQAPGDQPRVVQITVTEADLEKFGWPLSDGALADAIARIHADRPRAIGIDIFRDTPIAPGTDRLDKVLADTPEIIWADIFSDGPWAGLKAPAAAGARVGFSDLVQDEGGIVRRALLFLYQGQRSEASISLRLALLYLRAEGIASQSDADGNFMLGHVSLPPLDGDFGGYRGIDTGGYQVVREFNGPMRLRSFSLGDLMAGKVPSDALAGKIVVMGVVSNSVKDNFIAPVSLHGPEQIAGVTLQGLAAAQFVAHGMDGLPLTHALPRLWETIMLIAATVLGGLAGTFIPRLGWLALLTVGGAAGLLFGCYFAFLHALWLPVILLPMVWVLAIVVSRIAMTQVVHAQRAFLMRLFSTHISAPIAKEMWRRRADFVRLGRPVPVRLTATVLFSDVNDFTTATEDMEPEDICRWLEPYMTMVCNLIDEYGGVVERFSGDGVLAMFGVPVPRATHAEIVADAVAAVECAKRMAEELVELNVHYRATAQPEIRFAVGIQSGVLVGCSLGSAERLQYTTMGDTTNTAARLVNVAKDVMKRPGVADTCGIVVGGTTRELLGDRFPLRPLGAIELKGKARRADCFYVEGLAIAAPVFATAPKYGSVPA